MNFSNCTSIRKGSKRAFTLLETLVSAMIMVLIIAMTGAGFLFCTNLSGQSISQSYSGSMSSSCTEGLVHAIESSNAVMADLTVNGVTYESCATGMVLRQPVLDAQGNTVANETQYAIFYPTPDGAGNQNLNFIRVLYTGGTLTSASTPVVFAKNITTISFLYFKQSSTGGPAGPSTSSTVTDALDTASPTVSTFNPSVAYTTSTVSENAFDGKMPADMGMPDGTGATDSVYVETSITYLGSKSLPHITGARLRCSP